ncbi:hypothetical protein P152DRAFT_19287 [Eremomyces bilateralis CBS 781.70]|uniref:Hemerythrin-like domain-containing protein n=1 Tax=Eremomyces bilateralis CBS 781.70 TaxID=1392243 RepID=A0A6G1GHS0_9PEZI|nr:uncharacterized protein P152DRAFT_19287 [Eremomyces bilateralis CBS 781.70]KAF1817441.1 hypothetical protein P152DRAFT_19287 [Eremomyces bilateralis CBS 781.70]
MAPKPWADEPFALLETPSKTMDKSSHYAIVVASEMTHSHNVLIRGLNSIYQQAPLVKNPQDVEDLLFYCQAWVMMVHHHHETEEETLFPDLEEFTQKPGIMAGNQAQHNAFHDGMEKFSEYAKNTKPDEYKWDEMKAVIDAFAPSLYTHLREEIQTLLDLRQYDSDGVKTVWGKTEDAAKGGKHPHLFEMIMPCVMGNVDKTYEGGIHKEFPPWPFFIPYAVHYWFARSHTGAWRFCPSDFWGNPRPLTFQ